MAVPNRARRVDTLVADLGEWSVENPPEPAFFVDTGVHFALESYCGGFLVTDGASMLVERGPL